MFTYFFTYDSEIPEGLQVDNFSATHFTWLAATALVMAALILLYRKQNAASRRRSAKTAMIAVILLEVIREGWALLIGHYEISRHLPLHLCGVMIFIEAAAVFTDRPFFKEFSYAAGLPAAAMALITPEPSGYPFWNIQYLQSIFVHALLALIPLLWICGDGFRPNIRALPKMLGFLAGLAAFNFCVNFLLGSNYMFVRFAPEDTPIDLFNQWVGWPGYIGLLLITVFLFWTAMYLPWELAAKRRKRGESRAAAA